MSGRKFVYTLVFLKWMKGYGLINLEGNKTSRQPNIQVIVWIIFDSYNQVCTEKSRANSTVIFSFKVLSFARQKVAIKLRSVHWSIRFWSLKGLALKRCQLLYIRILGRMLLGHPREKEGPTPNL